MNARPLVIAHRGASGWLPENTLAAKAVAHAVGADFWETDVVVTRDQQLVVLHDLWLDELTDVRKKFSGRDRPDGLHYVIDFTLSELMQLAITERSRGDIAERSGRFPVHKSMFPMHTLDQEIELLLGMNHSTGRQVGLYVELKDPWFHADAGFDIANMVLQLLAEYGLSNRQDLVIIESFDAKELKRIRSELMPKLGMNLPLGQLIGYDRWLTCHERDTSGNWQAIKQEWLWSESGLSEIATYADIVSPALPMLVLDGKSAEPLPSKLIKVAHELGLLVHTYTLRADDLPSWALDLDQAHAWLTSCARVDGVFTDFPDRMVQFLQRTT